MESLIDELKQLLGNRYVVKKNNYNNEYYGAVILIFVVKFDSNIHYCWSECGKCRCEYGYCNLSNEFNNLCKKFNYWFEWIDLNGVGGIFSKK